MVKWDKGIDYETAYQLILKHLIKTRNQKQKCYDSILLIQLRNGLRISEASRAYLLFLKTKQYELMINLSKKKKHETRLVIIPGETVLCPELLTVKNEYVLGKHVRDYCLRTFKFNTHSLRYSFVTYLLKNGVNPSIIAKITRHSRLDYILTYTQQKTADSVLRNMF